MSIFLDLVTFTEETLDEKCHCLWSIVLFTCSFLMFKGVQKTKKG